MKDLKLIFAIFLLLVSCSDNYTSTVKRAGEKNQRLFGKESTIYNGVEYHIIEVDGVEYLATYRGGFYPLIKK